MKKDTMTLEKAKKTPAGGVLVGKREGQTMIYDDATVGGYFVGKLHKEGGIKGINKTTGQPIEVQSSEVIITAPAVADQTKREFEGQMLTNREILSKINVSGGGVSFEQGGDVPSELYFNGSSYNYGGKTMTDYEIMQAMNGCGCDEEYKNGGNVTDYQKKIADLKRENKSTFPKVPTNKIFFNQVEVLPASVVSTADPYLEDETKLPIESVDLKSIVPSQRNVTIPNIESTKDVESYPILFKLNDKYYVLDGHHRITNAILKDEKEVMAYVYDYKDQNLEFGGLSKGKSVEDIANMHNVSVSEINSQLQKGIEVESEHTSDKKLAEKIAKDHLVENPNYYTILDKVGLSDGGEIENLIKEGKIDLKFYETTPSNAREYGIECENPIYIQTLHITKENRLNGLGKKTLKYLEDYCKKNGNDVIFGKINNNVEFTKDERTNYLSDVELIKYWLHDNGYAVNDDNNDFHKVVNVRYNQIENNKKFINWFVGWYKDDVYKKMNIIVSIPFFDYNYGVDNVNKDNIVVLDIFEKKDQNIDAKKYLKEICDKADDYGVIILLEPEPRFNYIQDNESKKQKITKEYLINYYSKFDFEKIKNKEFLIRLPKNKNKIFNNGGQLDLVEESKKGDHPSRDLNNYNDVMDLGADGEVGIENGLAFADGGGIKSSNEQPSVVTTIEDGWKVSKYRDGKEIYKKEDKNYNYEILKNKRGEVSLTVIVLSSIHGESFNRTYSDVITEYFDSVQEAKKHVKEKYENMNLTTNKNYGQTLSPQVYEWSKVPSIFKNITNTKKVPFINNPIDKGLGSILEPFLDKNPDSERLNLTGVNFDENGITATNAHILITLPYPNEKYNGVYDINKVKKSNSNESLLINEKYAQYENVIPKKQDAGTPYLVDVFKLLQYTKTAIKYANTTTFHISFRFGDDIKIGFNGKYLIDILTTLLKLGHKEVYAFIYLPSRGVVFTTNKNYELGNDEILLIMPKFAYDFDGYGAEDVNNERGLKVYYDFNDNEIHNADGSVAEYKLKYESNMILDDEYLDLVQSFLNKTQKHSLFSLSFAKIENKVLTVSDLEIDIKIKNVDAPDGLYEFYNKAPMITMNPIDDYPSQRVFNKNEVNERNYFGEIKGQNTAFEFITFSEVFEFYLDKLLLSVGKDDLRPTMSGICIKKTYDNQIFLVTTNSHTLCKINITEYCEFEKDDRELEYILPVSYLKQFVKLADGSLHFKCSKANIFIETENIDFVARTIDGRYSKYDAIIPRTTTQKIVFDHVVMNNCLSSEKVEKFIEKYSKIYSLIFANEGNTLFLKVQKEIGYDTFELIDKIELCQIDFNYEQVDTNISLDKSVFLMMPFRDDFKKNQHFAFGKKLFEVMLDTITDTEVECYFTEPLKAYIFPIDAIDYKKTLPEEKTKQQPKKVAKAKKEAVNVEKEQIREAIETLLMLAEIEENEEQRKEIYEALEVINMLKEESFESGGIMSRKLTFEPIRTPLN